MTLLPSTPATPESDIDFTTIAIPENARMPRLALSMSWWAICSAMFWLVVSATLAVDFGAVNAIIALVLSVVSFGALNSIIARYSIRTGLSMALFSKIVFGSVGADIATLILFATATYYGVFEGSVIAQALHSFTGLPLVPAYFIVVCYSVCFVFGSVQNWLDKFNGVLLPFFLVGLVAAVALAIAEYGFSLDFLALGPKAGASPYGWVSCYSLYMGAWVIMMFTMDYARFGKPADADYHTKFNFGYGFFAFTLLLNGLVGIFLTAAVPNTGATSELSVVMNLLKLMGVFGLIFVWVSQTRINTANFYIAALNLHTLTRRIPGLHLPRAAFAVAIGAIVFVIMLTDVFSFILQALTYQGVLIEAWVGIAVVHMTSPVYARLVGPLVAGGGPEIRDGHVPAFNPGGLAAWFASTAIGIALVNAGPVWSIASAPATVVLAALFYGFALRYAQPSWFVRGLPPAGTPLDAVSAV